MYLTLQENKFSINAFVTTGINSSTQVVPNLFCFITFCACRTNHSNGLRDCTFISRFSARLNFGTRNKIRMNHFACQLLRNVDPIAISLLSPSPCYTTAPVCHTRKTGLFEEVLSLSSTSRLVDLPRGDCAVLRCRCQPSVIRRKRNRAH